MAPVGEVDSKGHLVLWEDPEAWIKNNPVSRLALVTSLKLDLRFKDDVEEIGESIGELTHLIRLEFRYCRSLKRVPNAITRLHKLEHLLFHSCSRLEELPANIGNLVSLTHLKLRFCKNIKFLPNSIVNLSKLTSLTLNFCESLVELPANIGQLASLTHLYLDCENIKSIPMSVANLPKLTSLSLSCLSLSELPCNLGLLKISLTSLNLSYCENIKCLPNSIANLSNLTSLSLHVCSSLVELPADIGQLVSLTQLELESCKNIKFLPNSIVNLPKLTSLSLPSLSLSELPSNLGDLKKSLTGLDLYDCKHIKYLPNSIVNLSNLTSLSLDYCESLIELPADIGQLVSLTQLKLDSCENIKSLPMSVANLPKLTSLSLSYLSLSEIPCNLGLLKKSLTSLDLSYCNNIKSLPMSIANLSNLTSLSLIYCGSLTELPSNLGQMKSLSHLELYSCHKIKSLPDSIKDLCSLDTLSIIRCDSLTQLPIDLNVLHLKLIGCCLHSLPTGLINLKYLEVVACSCSDEYFVNWKNPYSLQHLTISGCFRHINYIIKVPASLIQFVNLQVLSLQVLSKRKKIISVRVLSKRKIVHDFCIDNDIRFVELPENLDGLAHLCLLDIQYSSIHCLPWSITKLRKLRHLMLPEYFRLETLPYDLNDSVIISVKYRHVRKSLGELKTEIGQLPIPFGGANDAAQNPSILSQPGYLRLKGNPLQWIINNRNLLKLVRFLDLEDVEEFTDSIMQFSELTHLYLHITGDICVPDNYFVTLTSLTHLSLGIFEDDIHMPSFRSLSKLSKLETLHLVLRNSELPENFNMPVSLKHLSLSDSNNMRPLYHSLEKLTNLKTLDLISCYNCKSLPQCMHIHKLRLVDCSFDLIDSLPIGLHHLEILFFEDYSDLRCIFEQCWNQLVNLETLSITRSNMEFLPEDIARLCNLQKLQLKDCVSLKKLPSNLHELVYLHTLDISVTGIKTLPLSFVKQCKLQHLILPKCFNLESLPWNLKQVSIIDDTEETYYERMDYDASLYESKEETELGAVPGESCNEDNNVVSTVEIHETVPDEQTSADPFNSIRTGYIEHITTEQGGASQSYKDSHSNVSKDPIDENLQHTALWSQNQFNPLGNGGFMTNLPGAYSFSVNNQHAINDGQIGTMTFENAHEIASICQNISSWDGNSSVGGWNNHHALDLGHNNNSQSYDANAIRQEKEITPEAILEPLPRFVDAAEKHDVYHSWLKYDCSMQSPPKGLMKAEHLKIALCKCSKDLLANLKESMNLMHLAIKDCSQHHVKKFPTNLYELANLKTLSIQCIHIESLPSFAGLSSLLKLYIGGVSTSSPRLEKLPADLDKLDKLLAIDIHDTKIKCLPWNIKNLQKLRFLKLPLDFRLETLPCRLIESVVVTVDCMHIRKTWKELKTEMGLLSFHGVGVDEAQNFLTISSSGYLQLKEDPELWIMKNYDLCVSVQSLELELPVYLPKIGDSIGELPKLTYLYISGNINLDLKHFSCINKMLRHLSLQHCNIESHSDCLGKLSNLESLCLDLGDSNLPENLELLVNLKHLSLRHGSKHSNIDSMAKLSKLKALDLFQCDLESLPENLNLAALKLSGSNIRTLPTSLHRLEILHDKGRCERTKCNVASFNLEQLINMEKLSVTCYSMKLLPSIKRLQNLQELQLKDCSSLEALPNYLGKLVKLCTLDISGTRIKSLPNSITKLSNLENLILPKCFQQDNSLKYPNKGFINVTTDDIVELYFNDKSYYADDCENSMETSDEGNGIELDSIEGHNEAISKEFEEGKITVQTSPLGLHVTPLIGGQSNPAIQNDSTTVETEQGNCEHEQNQTLQNDFKGKKRKEISLETLQSFWSKNMTLEEAADESRVSRSTMKRRLKDLKLVWPSSKKGKQHLDDAKKRKHNSKAPFGSDSTQQNLVNPTNSTAQADIVGECIMGSDRHMFPSHVSSNSNAVVGILGNLALDTTVENVRENLMDTQGNMDSQHGEEHLDGANDQGHLESALHSSEKIIFATLEIFEEPLMVTESHMDTQQQAQRHLEGALYSSESNRSATLETFDPMVIESHMDIRQKAQGHLEGAFHSTESNRAATLETIDPMAIERHVDIQKQVPGNLDGALHSTESSGTIVVKATYKGLSVRIVFSLTMTINQLIIEIGMKFQLEVNKYRLLYQDENKDWMMLTSVEDLKYASQVAESLGTKFVGLSVIDYVV